MRSRTVQRATGLWLLVVGLWVGGTLLAAEAAYMEEQSQTRFRTRGFPPPDPEPMVWDRAVNPLLAWSQLVFRVEARPLDADVRLPIGLPVSVSPPEPAQTSGP